MSTSEELKSLSGASAAIKPVNLNPEEILKAEWDYIKGTASEAQEDRARVSTFFLGSAASLVAVLVGAKAEEFTPMIYYGFATLLLLMGITGWLTLGHLIRLRAAWFDSVLSMNLIKEYYFYHFQKADLNLAFNWTVEEDEKDFKLYKKWSVSYLFALQVAMMTAVMFAGAVVCIYLASGCSFTVPVAFFASFVGLTVGIIQMRFYRCRLLDQSFKLMSNYRVKKEAICGKSK